MAHISTPIWIFKSTKINWMSYTFKVKMSPGESFLHSSIHNTWVRHNYIKIPVAISWCFGTFVSDVEDWLIGGMEGPLLCILRAIHPINAKRVVLFLVGLWIFGWRWSFYGWFLFWRVFVHSRFRASRWCTCGIRCNVLHSLIWFVISFYICLFCLVNSYVSLWKFWSGLCALRNWEQIVW